MDKYIKMFNFVKEKRGISLPLDVRVIFEDDLDEELEKHYNSIDAFKRTYYVNRVTKSIVKHNKKIYYPIVFKYYVWDQVGDLFEYEILNPAFEVGNSDIFAFLLKNYALQARELFKNSSVYYKVQYTSEKIFDKGDEFLINFWLLFQYSRFIVEYVYFKYITEEDKKREIKNDKLLMEVFSENTPLNLKKAIIKDIVYKLLMTQSSFELVDYFLSILGINNLSFYKESGKYDVTYLEYIATKVSYEDFIEILIKYDVNNNVLAALRDKLTESIALGYVKQSILLDLKKIYNFITDKLDGK